MSWLKDRSMQGVSVRYNTLFFHTHTHTHTHTHAHTLLLFQIRIQN